jgi:hypothetical protein
MFHAFQLRLSMNRSTCRRSSASLRTALQRRIGKDQPTLGRVFKLIDVISHLLHGQQPLLLHQSFPKISLPKRTLLRGSIDSVSKRL